jgi:hypothetical protein
LIIEEILASSRDEGRYRHAESRDVTRDAASSRDAWRDEIERRLLIIEEILASSRDVTRDARDTESFPPIPPLGSPLDSLPNPPLIPPSESDARKAKRLPDDWSLCGNDYAFCERLGLDVQETFDSFCDYWRSKAGKDGVKLDWSATWRNWCRKDASSKKIPRPNGNGHAVSGHVSAYAPLRDPTEIMAEIEARDKARKTL